jgi:hypothetical protein
MGKYSEKDLHFDDDPFLWLTMNHDWRQSDILNIIETFKHYNQKIQNKQSYSWTSFVEDITKNHPYTLNEISLIVMAFHRENLFREVCENYAKKFYINLG